MSTLARNTHLPARTVDLQRFARHHEVELSTGVLLVTHARKQTPILKVYEKEVKEQLGQPQERDEDCRLTGEIHDVVVELNFGPVFEHGLERGAGTLRGFRLRNRQDLVRVHDGVRTLRHTTVKIRRGRQPFSFPMADMVVRTGYAM